MASSMTSDPSGALPKASMSAAPAQSEPAQAQPNTRQLFEAHASFVMRLVRRLGVRACDTEDVTQEVFMIVHRRIADLQGKVKPRSWLFGIARRVVANYLRKSRMVREQAADDEGLVALGDPAAELQVTRERAWLERALNQLDDDKRAVFVLFELEGLAMQEIADMVGCPLHTAYSRLYAARALVQRRVLVASGQGVR
jgi:RNA polymerase sigma-70 factor (ECF subfamily)